MSIIDSFPVVKLGDSDLQPEMFPMGWGLEFAGGHTAELIGLHQYRTYEGKLCGLPNDPDMYVERAVTKAREWDREFHGAPVIIHATIIKGVLSAIPDSEFASQRMSRSWSLLPAVTTFAEFRSQKPAKELYEAYSSALFVWWQPLFGIPTDENLINGIRHVNWPQVARDWTP